MNKVISFASVLAILATLLITPMSAGAKEMTGKEATFGRKVGNCLACHLIPGGKLPGNIGPPLIAMKAKYPNKADLRAQIWDATAINPYTIMPPFGKHQALTEAQIDKITDYIYTK